MREISKQYACRLKPNLSKLCPLTGRNIPASGCKCERCVKVREQKRVNLHKYRSQKNALIIKSFRQKLLRCIQTNTTNVTRACQCESCFLRRNRDREAHRKWKERDPYGWAHCHRHVNQKQIAKQRAKDPKDFTKRRTERNRDYRKKYYHSWRNRLSAMNYHNKAIVFWYYGNACTCCGEKTFEFLSIEHKNGDGQAHRQKVGSAIWSNIITSGFPDEFGVLCFNCNCAKGIFGTCPHQRTTAIVPVITIDEN